MLSHPRAAEQPLKAVYGVGWARGVAKIRDEGRLKDGLGLEDSTWLPLNC